MCLRVFSSSPLCWSRSSEYFGTGVYLDGDDVWQSPRALEWFIYQYPNLPLAERPIEFIQRPGEVVFVPRGWWHCVVNLDGTTYDSLSMAL
jgi:hypothetical protein